MPPLAVDRRGSVYRRLPSMWCRHQDRFGGVGKRSPRRWQLPCCRARKGLVSGECSPNCNGLRRFFFRRLARTRGRSASTSGSSTAVSMGATRPDRRLPLPRTPTALYLLTYLLLLLTSLATRTAADQQDTADQQLPSASSFLTFLCQEMPDIWSRKLRGRPWPVGFDVTDGLGGGSLDGADVVACQVDCEGCCRDEDLARRRRGCPPQSAAHQRLSRETDREHTQPHGPRLIVYPTVPSGACRDDSDRIC
jgi:hypothetical protein